MHGYWRKSIIFFQVDYSQTWYHSIELNKLINFMFGIKLTNVILEVAVNLNLLLFDPRYLLNGMSKSKNSFTTVFYT